MGASLDEAARCVSTACPHLTGGPQVDRAGVGVGLARRYSGVRRLLSSLPVLRCSVERTRLEGSVPKTAGEERTVRNGRFRSCVHCGRGRCPRPAHGPLLAGRSSCSDWLLQPRPSRSRS